MPNPTTSRKKNGVEDYNRWGLFYWCPKKALARNKPGETHHFEHLGFSNGLPLFFKTRKEAREYAEIHDGYRKTRKDLRDYPHYCRMPIPVRIKGIIYDSPS